MFLGFGRILLLFFLTFIFQIRFFKLIESTVIGFVRRINPSLNLIHILFFITHIKLLTQHDKDHGLEIHQKKIGRCSQLRINS